MSAHWRDRALCAETDPEIFFPDKGESTRNAKRVCFACEVRVPCLEYALERADLHGVWGGKSYKERIRLRHESHPDLVRREAQVGG